MLNDNFLVNNINFSFSHLLSHKHIDGDKFLFISILQNKKILIGMVDAYVELVYFYKFSKTYLYDKLKFFLIKTKSDNNLSLVA